MIDPKSDIPQILVRRNDGDKCTHFNWRGIDRNRGCGVEAAKCGIDIRQKAQPVKDCLAARGGLCGRAPQWECLQNSVSGWCWNRDRIQRSSSLPLEIALKNTKEEGFAFDDWSAEIRTELMVQEPGSLFQTCPLVLERQGFESAA